MRRSLAALAAVVLLSPTAAFAGDLTPTAAREVLDALDTALDGYVDPAVGARVKAVVKANRDRYLAIDDRAAFAAAVSADSVATSHDIHLKLSVETSDARAARLTDEQRTQEDHALANGLMTLRRLPGNIGYLKLSYFVDGAEGTRMVDMAMAMLKDTDALIIDLRENRGGGGTSDAELRGHLSRTPIPMAVIHWRQPDGSVEIMARQPGAPEGGPLFADKPVFLLTSARTYSAAEGVAYDLKVVGRAVLVGQTTGGAGNPSNRPGQLGHGIRVFVPTGRVVHPVTGGGWEGVGVSPDVVTPPSEALTEAYRRALAVARPRISTPRLDKERAAAVADPRAALDEAL